jgi:hypothetical protein
MMSNIPCRLLVAAALVSPLAALAEGETPWLPIPSQLLLGLSVTEQSGDEAWIGTMRLPVTAITGGGASKYRRSTTVLRATYGLSDAFALDASIGAGKVRAGAADNDSGFIDSTVGLSWRLLDEFERPGLPTFTLRGAAIFAGGYDGGRFGAIGKGENGVELALLVGKQFGPVALWAGAGIQNYAGSVPNARFYDVGARYRLGSAWSVSLGYSDKRYRSDLDIGGPGFTPARFQEVQEERALGKIGLSYAFAANQGVALNLARVVSGRNTVRDDQIVNLSYTYGF